MLANVAGESFLLSPVAYQGLFLHDKAFVWCTP